MPSRKASTASKASPHRRREIGWSTRTTSTLSVARTDSQSPAMRSSDSWAKMASVLDPRTRCRCISRRRYGTSESEDAALWQRTSSRDSSSSPYIQASALRTSSESSPRSRGLQGPRRTSSKGRNRRGHIGASMANAGEAFAKALHEGHEREHDQLWQEAINVYSKLLASLRPNKDPEARAMRAIALM